jgi:hypothetical protein
LLNFVKVKRFNFSFSLYQELSEVLWSMAFRMGISTAPPIGVLMMFLIFGGWACITIAILCVMEGKANISQ